MEPEPTPAPAPAATTTPVQPKLAVIQEARFTQNAPGERHVFTNTDTALCIECLFYVCGDWHGAHFNRPLKRSIISGAVIVISFSLAGEGSSCLTEIRSRFSKTFR